MSSLEENFDRLDELNTMAFGIGVDSVPSNKAWAESLGIKRTRLLADFWPHGAVAKMYGLFREQGGTSERANVIVDESGKIIFIKVYEISKLPDIQEIINFLKQL